MTHSWIPILVAGAWSIAAAEPRYLLSSSSRCPSGGELIWSRAECRNAALELLLDTTEPVGDSRSSYPWGCYIAQALAGGNQQLYWNTAGSNASSAVDARTVCAWGEKPPENETLGYEGGCSADGTTTDHRQIPEISPPVTVPSDLPEVFDSRTRWPFCFDSVVRNQGSCGSCWAFATTSVVQHRACIFDCEVNGRCDDSNAMIGRHVSVQHVMGCATDSKKGCQGGWAHNAYAAMQEKVAFEYHVPYRCGGGDIADSFQGASLRCTAWPWATPLEQCPVEQDDVKVTSYYRLGVTPGNAAALIAAELVARGPVAVDFCVVGNFFSYWSRNPTRIYVEADGCGEGIRSVGGHMVLLTGFGVAEQNSQQVPYWLAQNSWSAGWGDRGFFRVQRGVNLCGIETIASAVTVTVAADIPPIPNETSTSTTATTTTGAENATTSTTVSSTALDPNATILADDSDDGLMRVPHFLIWLLAVLLILFCLCCCLACGLLACIMWLQPEKRRDWTDVAAGKATVRNPMRPTRQVDGTSSDEMEAGEAQVKMPFTNQQRAQPQPPPQQQQPPTEQQPPQPNPSQPAVWGKVQAVDASDRNPWRNKLLQKKEPVAVVPPKGSAPAPKAKPKPGPAKTAAPPQSASSAKEPSEPKEEVIIPPWWGEEPETYNDNVHVRAKEEEEDAPVQGRL
mmetsp:Transcript_60892/g.145127  ORF Transcript_60892/g.145127 Transcript_60892/m.145127 type:complete len:680 (+) Transcript_60892:88-2127(+)